MGIGAEFLLAFWMGQLGIICNSRESTGLLFLTVQNFMLLDGSCTLPRPCICATHIFIMHPVFAPPQ
jgi:hypothetical protein